MSKNKKNKSKSNKNNKLNFSNFFKNFSKKKSSITTQNKSSNKYIEEKSENKNKDNILKIKTDLNSKNLIHSKKLFRVFIVIILILVLLIGRIGFLQFIEGNSLKEQAYQQQTINQIISPKRGNIYDSTGKALAISAQVDTITINPSKIKSDTDAATQALKEKVASGLSKIFELDYNEVLEKVNSSSSVETIAKKVEQDKVEILKQWEQENNINVGINIDEDSKRYYPYSNIASHVIGFCGNDNQGLTGLESKWDSVLTGTPGKIVSAKDGNQEEIPNAEEKYIAAENGSSITLTLDLNIQSIVEKYLKQAVENNSCSRGGNVIVMNPKTGDILAMASYPDYNLNDPFSPNASLLSSNYNSLSAQDKSNALYEMWKNKSVSELYEPGSVFKIITSSVALEENITGTDNSNDFLCTGQETFSDGTIIKCWRDNPHGYQTLRQALCNSCNPAFMQLGKRIGANTLYKYYDAFGLFNKTGVGLAGEENSLFTNLNDVGPVELATMSFGQRLNITPLQMITAVSAVANDGILMQPRIVKELTNTDTNSISQVSTTQVRQVISSQTADKVKSMMESVVTEGTGKYGAVAGYSVGGKTGTSEPTEANKKDGYVASYVAISPVEDTQVVLLLTLYDPHGASHQGGQIAGPVVSQMLSEILPYMGIPSDTDTTKSSNLSTNLITIPDVRNKTVTEAQKVLKNAKLNSKITVNGDSNTLLVEDQVPKPGTTVPANSTIVLYSSENTVRTSNITVPDLTGMTIVEATNALKAKNLNITYEGAGIVIGQDYAKGTTVEEGTVIKVTLKQTLKDAQ